MGDRGVGNVDGDGGGGGGGGGGDGGTIRNVRQIPEQPFFRHMLLQESR
jgi:hypothetical protein